MYTHTYSMYVRIYTYHFFDAVTDPAPPSEPLNLMSSPMPLSVSLTWDLPLHTENLIHYTIQFEPPPSNDSFNTTERNFTVTGLIPETMYTFTVTSVGVNGTIGGMAQVTGTTTTPSKRMCWTDHPHKGSVHANESYLLNCLCHTLDYN